MATETKLILPQKQLVDIKGTLLQIPKGKSLIINTKDVKASSIRSSIRYLNKESYWFKSSEKGLINQVKVTRFK